MEEVARETETEAPRGAGKRQESRALTRQRLLAVGRVAFARKGHAGANLKDDILVPARVSVGSFYHQFRDKTELFLEILREHSGTFRAMIREAQAPPPASLPDQPFDPGLVARHTFEVVFRIAEDHGDLFQVMVREQWSSDPRVRRYLRENHRQWIASLAADYHRVGLVPPGLESLAELAAELISAMTLGTVLRWLDHPPDERARLRDELLDGLARFTLSGVTALVAAPRPVASVATRTARAGAHRKGEV